MKDYRLKRETSWTPELRTTIFLGFFLRMVMLIVIVYIASEYWDIFYLEDDKKYEELAAVYKANARSMMDMELFNKLTIGYAADFWPFVMCIGAKLFSTVYIGRFLNVIFSTICIGVTYNLCYEISDNQKTALTAARLFAFLPFPILVSCFPIKDIFIMMGTMYAFFIFVRVQRERKVSALRFGLLAVLLLCIYLSRGAVTELLLIFFLVYYLQRLYKAKKHLAAVLLLMAAVAVFVAFRSTILGTFESKWDTYGNYAVEEAAGLNAIRVTGITDIYKLPLAYAFAMLQPMKLELLTLGNDVRPWRTVMNYSNMTMYPVAVGAWLYMFSKKHNLFFWLSSFAMFSAILMMSLGVSRHYLFMLPIHMVNYSLYMEETHPNFKNRRTLVIVGTFALVVLVFCYSLVKLL
ncbi:MAG: hypothetical protein IJN04_05355 [Clostridia bacterium]|nr:hypothetical protein [Clostridia bacterium]